MAFLGILIGDDEGAFLNLSVWWQSTRLWRLACVVLTLLLVITSFTLWSTYKQQLSLENQLSQTQLTLTTDWPVANEIPEQIATCKDSSLPLADQTLQQICSAYMAYAQSQSTDDSVEAFVSTRLEQDIQQKYAFLFQVVALGKQDSDQLMTLLLERESLLNAPVQGYFTEPDGMQAEIDEQQNLLGEVDARVREVLGPDAYGKYQLLKDSGFEQYQLERFSQSLTSSEQISPEQQSQLLLAKLQYKQAFEQQLAQWEQGGGASSDSTSFESLDMTRVREALEAFKVAYYSDSAALLSNKQLSQLKAFENAQFDALLNSYSAQVPAGE